jgi:hypothetical protein
MKVAVKRVEFVYLLILLSLLVAIFAFNAYAGTTISSPQNLAIDLASPPETPQAWQIQDWPVVKYRALFKTIVQGSWAQFFPPSDAWDFYLVFVGWSFFFFSCAIVTFYFYLRALDFDERQSFAGGLLFLLSPPVLLAYKYPVYTREDCLAYFLLTLGLIAAFKSKAFLVGLISVAATLTRDTAMILPLAYLVGGRDSWPGRIYVAGMTAAAFVGIRLWWGVVVGNSFESSILNYLFPYETLAFLFCVFGALWLPYVLGLRNRWQAADYPSEAWRLLGTSGPIILAFVLISALTIARAREARIVYILFPWAIPFAMDWFRSNSEYVKRIVSSRSHWAFAISIMGVISVVVLYFHLTNPALMRYYLADFKNGYWLFLGALHLSATLAIFLPRLRPQFQSQSA